MIFVDTSVIIFSVGGNHPLRAEARDFFRNSLRSGTRLVTSTVVLEELLHTYVAVSRGATLDAAFRLVEALFGDVWAVEAQDVLLARTLVHRYPAVGARALVHCAMCRRRGVQSLKTYDRALRGVF